MNSQTADEPTVLRIERDGPLVILTIRKAATR